MYTENLNGSNVMDGTLVVYASKHGICEKAAGILAKNIGCPYQNVANLRFIKDYHTIIMGSSIYMSKGSKAMNSFIKAHKQELMNKNIACFIVCCQSGDFQINSQLESAFPQELLNHAFYTGCLGRGVNMARLGLLEKKIFVKASGINRSFFEPQLEEQEKLIEAYKNLAKLKK